MKTSSIKNRYHRQFIAFLMLCFVFFLIQPGCGTSKTVAPEKSSTEEIEDKAETIETTISLVSPAFKDGGEIPAKYTCDGEDLSPPLAWGELPPGTRRFILIMEDLDAVDGVFTHWIAYDIPSDIRELSEAVPPKFQLNEYGQMLQGLNDFKAFGHYGYNGPCPPPGSPHRYQFTIYAVDRRPTVMKSADKKVWIMPRDTSLPGVSLQAYIRANVLTGFL